MYVMDKKLKRKVNVCDESCLKKKCYWPRDDPGIFNQGQGYRKRVVTIGWLCGTREVRGCPDEEIKK